MSPGSGRGPADPASQRCDRIVARPKRVGRALPEAVGPGQGPSGPALGQATGRIWAVAVWTPTVARMVLGLVLAWFGYHEFASPARWTGYVPVVSATSHLAEILVLVHGWFLLVLATALITGVAPRLAAALSSLFVLEIVLSVIASGGFSAAVLMGTGMFCLAVAVAGAQGQRLLLRR